MHDSAPDYETRIAHERAAKDAFFRTSPHSPIPAADRAGFDPAVRQRRSRPARTSRWMSDSSTPISAIASVIEFELRGPYTWNGGSVTMRLHEGRLDGQPIYYVRTDSSDQAFAEQEGLVFVPLLSVALKQNGAVGRLFLVDGGITGQTNVLSTGPGREDFSPLYRLIRVRFTGDPVLLESAGAIDTAVADGRAALEETQIVVNYPAVKWPGSELAVDTVVEKPLEGGPLLGPPDLVAMAVTFMPIDRSMPWCHEENAYVG